MPVHAVHLHLFIYLFDSICFHLQEAVGVYLFVGLFISDVIMDG